MIKMKVLGFFVLLALGSVMANEKVAIGIDLGTTYSCVGVIEKGQVQIITNDQGNRITPSYISFTEEGERLIGDAAKNQVTANPANTVYDVKRIIGRTMDDSNLIKDIKSYPFTVVNKNNKPNIKLNVGIGNLEYFTPEEISAMILSKMKSTAEGYLGVNVTDAVITVPAYFNDAQRQATKDAARISGLNPLRIINEPTAAAIAYGFDSKEIEAKNILVFDLGGGTFDVTILTIEEGVFEVLSTNGDTHLGGEDFDQRVIEHYIKLIKKKHGVDIRGDSTAVQKLRKGVEKAKRALSSTFSTKIDIESLSPQIVDFSETLTRAKFEELNGDLFRKTLVPVENALKDAGLRKDEIDEIILVGGSTRIPKIQKIVSEYFKKEAAKGINPDEAVAFGATAHAGVLTGSLARDVLIIDVTPLSVGIETVGNVMSTLIHRNTAVPTSKGQIFSTAVDNQEVVTIKIYQGERKLTTGNTLLGSFDLTGIPPAPRGVPKIEVTLNVDVNGIYTVTAVDKGTNQENSIKIETEQGRMSPEEIERAIEEAERMKEEDDRAIQRINAQHDLEKYAYSMKETIKNSGSKISDEDLESVNNAIETAIAWIDEYSNVASVEEIENQKTILQDICQPIVSNLYNDEAREEL